MTGSNFENMAIFTYPHPDTLLRHSEQGTQSQGQAAIFDVEVVIEAVFGAFAAHA